MPAARPDLQERARALRRKGESVKEIARAIGASTSSVSVWVRDLELSDDQRAELRARVRRNGGNPRARVALSAAARDRRLEAQVHGRALATRRDPLHMAGCMLYWAEGSKTRNSVVFTNADPEMNAYFLRFLRECYAVADEQVALTVNCFLGNGVTLEEIESWWLERLGLPRSCLRKPSVNRPSSASKRRRPQLLHGTARIAVASTFIVQSIYGAIQEYAGCERPEWLDIGVRLPSP